MTNQNQQQSLVIDFTLGGLIKRVGNGFVVPLSIIVKRGNNPLSNRTVNLTEGNNFIANVTTNSFGEAKYDYVNVLDRAGCAYEIRALCSGKVEKLTIILPELTTKPKKDKNPEQMYLTRTHDQAGTFNLMSRVLMKKGISSNKANVVFRLENSPVLNTVSTDASGYAAFLVPTVLNPGESLKAFSTVNGIGEEAKIVLRRAPNFPRRFSSEWWHSLFGISAIARWVIYLFWIVMIVLFLTVEWQPLLTKNPTKLSQQQELFNKGVGSEWQYTVKDDNGQEFPGNLCLIMLGVSTIVMVGSVVIHRKRIIFALLTQWDKISAKWLGHAIDPMSERVLEWLKVLSVVKNDKNADGVVDEKDKDTIEKPETTGHHKPMFWKLFSSDLLSELVTGALILMFKGGKFSKFA